MATRKNEPTSPKSAFPKDRVGVASLGDSFLVTIGPVTLMLDQATAEDLMFGLADALEPADSLDVEWN